MIRLNTADFRHGRSLVITLIVALVLSSSSLLRVQAAAGDLDPTFGTGGKVTTGPNATATGLAIQNDGKLVVVGGFAATRYNTDGSLDSSFGIGGRVTTSFFFFTDLGSYSARRQDRYWW